MAGNRSVTGKYVGRDSAWLASTLTKLQTAYDAVLLAQSYSRPGYTFNRVQFDAIATELAEVQYAIDAASGTFSTRTYADLSV